MSEEIYALWVIKLNVTCPHCKENVDLLEDSGFFNGRDDWRIPHRGKEEVKCPNCGHDFKAILEY